MAAAVAAVLFARLAASDGNPAAMLRLAGSLGLLARLTRPHGDEEAAGNQEAEMIRLLNAVADSGSDELSAQAISYLEEARRVVSERGWALATGKTERTAAIPDLIPGYGRFRSAFAAALDPQLHSIEWLDREILEGRALYWHTDTAAIVATLKHYPTGAKDIEGLIAAGELDDIVGVLIPQAEAWARESGCVGAIIQSREGWAKVLRRHGYEPFQTAVRKVL